MRHPLRLAVIAACLLAARPCLLAVAAPVSIPAERDYAPWVGSSFGGGGYVQNIVFSPARAGRLYGYIDVGGAYRSDDAGRTWRMLHGALPAEEGYYSVRGLAPSPAEPDVVLIAVGNQWAPARGVFRSDDAGATWRPVLTARVYGNEDHRWTGTVFAWIDARTVFFGSGGDGLFRSDDAGLTWKEIPGLRGVCINDLDFDAKGRAWICAAPLKPGNGDALSGGFFASTDSGLTWRRLAERAPAELAVTADGALLGLERDRSVIRSTDAGATWQDYSEGLPVNPANPGSMTSESRFQALAAGPDFDLVASARGTVYRRDHGAPAWSAVVRETVIETVDGRPWWGRLQPGHWPHFGAATASLVIDPANPARWWLTDWYAAYESNDAGASWTLRIDGLEDTVIHTVAADPIDPAVVHVGMADNAYARSLDGGLTFDTSKPASNMKMLAASRALPSRLYAVGDNQAEWRASTVWLSTDRGDTWQQSPMLGLPPRADHSINSIVAHPARPYEVYVAVSGPVAPGAGGVYVSRDGGRAFEPLSSGLPEGVRFFRHDIWAVGPELAINGGGELVAASHADGRVYRLDGARWTPVDTGSEGKPQDLVSDGVDFYLARREGGLWRGTEGGRVWKRLLDAEVGQPAADPAHRGRLAAVTPGGVRLSEDNGATWRTIPLPPHGMVSALAFAGERLVAGTRGAGLFWARLNAASTRAVAASPAAPGLLRVAEQAASVAPVLPVSDFAASDVTLAHWSRPWTGAGKLAVDWTPASFDAAGGSLRLRSVEGPATGSTGMIFNAVPNTFHLSASWRLAGKPGLKAQLALRSSADDGSQLSWLPLGELSIPDAATAASPWQTLSRSVNAAPASARCELVLLLEGDGAVELDALAANVPPQIYGTPVQVTP